MSKSQEYPRWVHHADHPSRIVESEDELNELGAGWQTEPVQADQGQGRSAEEAFQVFLENNGFDEDTEETKNKLFLAFKSGAPAGYYSDEADDLPVDRTGDLSGQGFNPGLADPDLKDGYDARPVVEYGHLVGPQDEVHMVDSEEAIATLQDQAKSLGLKFDKRWGSKRLQAAIDEYNAAKSSTPPAAE